MLNDMDFIKTCDVPGPTKEAIRAIILYKSAVTPNDEVVDVGCGTGGITCEFAQRAKKVTSIDTNPDAISVTKQNLEKFNLGDNVKLINDSGSNALKNIGNMDIAVVGGSGRELEDILEIIDSKLNPKVRIIVTDILVDSTFKICPTGVDGVETFTKKLQELSEASSTNIVLLISAEESELPESINAVCQKV